MNLGDLWNRIGNFLENADTPRAVMEPLLRDVKEAIRPVPGKATSRQRAVLNTVRRQLEVALGLVR